MNSNCNVCALSLSHDGIETFPRGHRGPRSFFRSALQGDSAQKQGGTSFAKQLMPGVAAEPPGAMSHLPSLSTGFVRRIAAGENVGPVVLQLIGTVAASLATIMFVAMAAKALIFLASYGKLKALATLRRH